MKLRVLVVVAILQDTSAALAEPARLAQAFFDDAVAPREVLAIVRSAGLLPISPPVRAGPTYALRAVDPDGMELRIIVDARVGEIISIRRFAPADVGRPPFGGPPLARRPDHGETAGEDRDVDAPPPARVMPQRKPPGEKTAGAVARPLPPKQKPPDVRPEPAARPSVDSGKPTDAKVGAFPPVTPLD